MKTHLDDRYMDTRTTWRMILTAQLRLTERIADEDLKDVAINEIWRLAESFNGEGDFTAYCRKYVCGKLLNSAKFKSRFELLEDIDKIDESKCEPDDYPYAKTVLETVLSDAERRLLALKVLGSKRDYMSACLQLARTSVSRKFEIIAEKLRAHPERELLKSHLIHFLSEYIENNNINNKENNKEVA